MGIRAGKNLNGSQIQAATFVSPGSDWHIAGTGDFDGDGRADILWRNDNGTVAVWEMNDGAQVAGAQVVSPLSTDWGLGVHHYELA
jgi:serralysin